MTQPPIPESVERQLASAERDRERDRGHFNQYGLRSDPRPQDVDRANPGTGDNARRFGASGDPATYVNRADEPQPPPLRGPSSDAPANRGAP
ncbi:hypothetical protein [Melaminivora suipulveris]|nr:hypothetical protein [Melaminivora suipulveris]